MYINPYDEVNNRNGRWLKANFHTHAGTGINTCGAYKIKDVINLYKEAGYNILAISNHDIVSDVKGYQFKNDNIILNAYEHSRGSHMLCINVNNVIEGSHQEAINGCINQNGLVIICHPHFLKEEHWSKKDIDNLYGYTGIEIINGVISRLGGSGLATDIWDYLLSQGKLVWGFGSDDFHRWYDLARAWNMIYMQSDKYKDLKGSIQKGRFYVSTGLNLEEITLFNEIIKITVNMKDSYIKRYKYIFTGEDGRVLDEQDGKNGEYRILGNEPYIRIKAISEDGAMLWTQPIYKKELFKKYNTL